MDLKQLLCTDNDAVSPVIGVVLMVAVTVILAAVIATFVLGVGDTVNDTAPQASFNFNYEQNAGGSDELAITHNAGDTIAGENLNVTSTGAATEDDDSASIGTDVFTGTIDAGTTATINNTTFKRDSDNKVLSNAGGPDSRLNLSAATVRVVYIDTSSDSSATLGRWEGTDV
ncbi:flagellin-like protein [Haloarcula quadrata]|uniref:Flagellin-like protein n=1 Tax=Haloarcula quadrata TaxID=182779 RepID=A0A495R909_9EURY|nr:type IV pilin N-terminal domain-containing protein [Haloarcula quadrata]RKS83338.1 flagellin-like protein [Haloarcula quadrata]